MKIKSTLLFGASGSFEEVTIKKWKRFRVLSHKSQGNKSNVSQRIKDQQSAVTMIVGMLNMSREQGLYGDSYQLATWVKNGWKEHNSFPGWFPAFMSRALKYAVDFSVPGSPSIVLENLQIANGSLMLPPPGTVSVNIGSNVISVEWSTIPIGNQNQYDDVSLVAANLSNGKWWLEPYLGSRSSESAGTAPDIGFMSIGDQIAVFVLFSHPDWLDGKKMSSDSLLFIREAMA